MKKDQPDLIIPWLTLAGLGWVALFSARLIWSQRETWVEYWTETATRSVTWVEYFAVLGVLGGLFILLIASPAICLRLGLRLGWIALLVWSLRETWVGFFAVWVVMTGLYIARPGLSPAWLTLTGLGWVALHIGERIEIWFWFALWIAFAWGSGEWPWLKPWKKMNEETKGKHLTGSEGSPYVSKETAGPGESEATVDLKTDAPTRTDQKQKYVYVISHPNFPCRYKVGVASYWTRLNRGKIEFKLLTPWFRETEKYIHDLFPSRTPECVEGDLDAIIEAIKTRGGDYREQKYVYVISHPNFKGFYKVGIASDWQSRLNSYQTSDPERQYKIEYKLLTPRFRETEKYIHKSFENKHEWVKGDLDAIIEAIKNHKPIPHTQETMEF